MFFVPAHHRRKRLDVRGYRDTVFQTANYRLEDDNSITPYIGTACSADVRGDYVLKLFCSSLQCSDSNHVNDVFNVATA